MRQVLLRGLKRPRTYSRDTLGTRISFPRLLGYACQRYTASLAKRPLSTLDPAKLTPNDWLDVRGLKSFSVRWGETKQSVLLQYDTRNVRAWPSSAMGFLYFHRPPSPTMLHPAAGSLRLRLAESPSDLHHAFSDGGKDLLAGAGGYTPWSIPLLTLWRSPHWAPVCHQLYPDGFITSESASEIDKLIERSMQKKGDDDGDDPFRKLGHLRSRLMSPARVIEDVTQPWTLELDLYGASLVILAEDRIYSVRLIGITMSQIARNKTKGRQGVALVQFELDERERLVLRLLKYIVPPDFDIVHRNLDQTEGQLIRQYKRHNWQAGWLLPQVWSADPLSVLSPASYAALAKIY
ncbi:hypothetical protein BKA70DRAFT_1314968, partial [Coprinopsis sp. MPI-PUGE-AT-0042]